MNYAVEGNVCFDYYSDDNNTYGYIDNTVCLENLGLKDKDRVKLIIVKDD
jgi:hypothetical protein